MADASSFLENRIDRASLPLAVGDLVALALVLTLGTVRHTGVDVVTAEPGYLAVTLLPWLLGWALVAPLVGAYSAGAAESAKAAVPLAVRSWVLADLVGVALRATPLFAGGRSLTGLAILYVVTLFAGAVALAAWRYVYFAVQ